MSDPYGSVGFHTVSLGKEIVMTSSDAVPHGIRRLGEGERLGRTDSSMRVDSHSLCQTSVGKLIFPTKAYLRARADFPHERSFSASAHDQMLFCDIREK